MADNVVNLNDLGWDDEYFSEIRSGEYNLFVSPYIQDPQSPDNSVRSNTILIKK
jgi:hypothetical protein